jgi:hypothetical protein
VPPREIAPTALQAPPVADTKEPKLEVPPGKLWLKAPTVTGIHVPAVKPVIVLKAKPPPPPPARFPLIT